MKIQNSLTDQELIQLYSQGNVSAISVLVNRHRQKIFTTIYLLVKDRYLAEDIFQDLFIRIIQTLKNGPYTETGKFLPWALQIAHNMCIDHMRKEKRMPVIKTAAGDNLFDLMHFTEPAVDTQLARNETCNLVQKMIDQLPDEQREVIILRHYADLGFKEIAALTNISINTALGRMRYGLLNLRKLMTEKQIAL
jgi:RNA polymerase sigma-70 factor (ECF subfamily)